MNTPPKRCLAPYPLIYRGLGHPAPSTVRREHREPRASVRTCEGGRLGMDGAPVEHGHHLTHKRLRDEVGVREDLRADELNNLQQREPDLFFPRKRGAYSNDHL